MRDGRRSNRERLSRDADIDQGRELRRYDPFSREAQSTASTRNTASAPRDHRDEPLRVLVRILARQAARERFEREVAAEREAQPEVTLH